MLSPVIHSAAGEAKNWTAGTISDTLPSLCKLANVCAYSIASSLSGSRKKGVSRRSDTSNLAIEDCKYYIDREGLTLEKQLLWQKNKLQELKTENN